MGWDPNGYGIAALSEGTRSYIQSDGDLRAGLIAAASAAAHVGFSKWQTTTWIPDGKIDPMKTVTKAMWDAKKTDWAMIGVKSLIKGAVGGVLGAAGGQKFNKAFWRSALPTTANEVMHAYVPWGATIVSIGGRKRNFDEKDTYINRYVYEWGLDYYGDDPGFFDMGGFVSRFASNYIPCMDSISKIHDIFAITLLNSACFGQSACPSTMLPAAAIVFGSIIDENQSSFPGKIR